MSLRDYQTDAINQIRNAYRAGFRKVLLHLATGGGKTATFCEILKSAYHRGTPALVAVRGRKLIQQASDRLTREGVPHGIIMAGAERDQHALIRVCSIDTLYARRDKGEAPPAKFIVIDEAHQTQGGGYEWFLEQYKDVRLLAVTATPHLRRGMRHVAQTVVYPITAAELTSRGYLVPLRYFAVETPDLSGVETTGDDYNLKQLGDKMTEAALHGHIPEHYLRHGKGGAAVCFAVNVKHSKTLVDQFLANGIAAEHIDANATDQERKAAISRLESGETKVISNVGILTTGVDIPCLRAIIMARPTKSYNLWIQMIGRGTRPSTGKANCIILDHAGNTLKHGFLSDERECHLDGVPKGDRAGEGAPAKRCMECYAVAPIKAAVCPECGAEFPVAESKHDEAANLVEITEESIIEAEIARLVDIAKRKNYRKGWVRYQLENRFGKEKADLAWNRIARMRNWYRPPDSLSVANGMQIDPPLTRV